MLSLERARPKRRLCDGDLVFERKKRFKKMASDVPEIKLVNLLYYSFKEKNTLLKRFCLDQPLLFIMRNETLGYNTIKLI